MLSPKELGSMARERREALHRSQKDIAKALSVSQTTLHKLETGVVDESKHWPRLFTLLELPLDNIDPIYSRLNVVAAANTSGMSAVLHAKNGTAAAAPESPAPTGGRVMVKVEREAIVIAGVRYASVETPEGPAMLITWTARNGEMIDGLMDRAMIESAMRRFHELALRLGIDPAKSPAPPPPPKPDKT
jgi:transcriptional regulator with XRE-family HTH domain